MSVLVVGCYPDLPIAGFTNFVIIVDGFDSKVFERVV